jgi:hypothetical protein
MQMGDQFNIAKMGYWKFGILGQIAWAQLGQYAWIFQFMTTY